MLSELGVPHSSVHVVYLHCSKDVKLMTNQPEKYYVLIMDQNKNKNDAFNNNNSCIYLNVGKYTIKKQDWALKNSIHDTCMIFCFFSSVLFMEVMY